MSQIKSVKIGGFRRLFDLSLDMRPIMVIIGANSVGKTSMLDVFSMLAASAAGDLNEKLNEWGGISNIATYNNNTPEITLSVSMDIPAHEPLYYHLNLVPKSTSYAIKFESLSQKKIEHTTPFKYIESKYDNIQYFDVEQNHLVRPTWEHNPLETSLSQVPKMFKQPEDLRRTLSSSTFYHFLDVKPRSPIKLPQPMQPALLPGKQGEEIIPMLYYLRESASDRFEIIEETIRAAFPSFERLNFPPVAAGMLTMTWKDKNFVDPLYMHQLSEGMLRFLWLVSLLQSPGLSSITMIDEPEVSLHPELLHLLADLLREASERTQLIIATHSDRLISFLHPDEVIVMDINEEGYATAIWADKFDLERWLQEYSLDEIWQMGRMGGRS